MNNRRTWSETTARFQVQADDGTKLDVVETTSFFAQRYSDETWSAPQVHLRTLRAGRHKVNPLEDGTFEVMAAVPFIARRL